jgi:hypothetical protein
LKFESVRKKKKVLKWSGVEVVVNDVEFVVSVRDEGVKFVVKGSECVVVVVVVVVGYKKVKNAESDIGSGLKDSGKE